MQTAAHGLRDGEGKPFGSISCSHGWHWGNTWPIVALKWRNMWCSGWTTSTTGRSSGWQACRDGARVLKQSSLCRVRWPISPLMECKSVYDHYNDCVRAQHPGSGMGWFYSPLLFSIVSLFTSTIWTMTKCQKWLMVKSEDSWRTSTSFHRSPCRASNMQCMQKASDSDKKPGTTRRFQSPLRKQQLCIIVTLPQQATHSSVRRTKINALHPQTYLLHKVVA